MPEGELFAWDPTRPTSAARPTSTACRRARSRSGTSTGARCLVLLGDSVTTDHISPAGSIKPDSPAGQYLVEHGVERKDFNSYGSRRGNHEVMVRGTFANVRLRNLLVPGSEGTWTVHLPDGEEMTIFEASQRYLAEGTPPIVLAGKEYGSGSSRDWAAKGPNLLGVGAVIAESYERIHRSNLLMMGILPLQFQAGETPETLGLTGRERFAIEGIENGEASEVTVRADDATFTARVRLDTPREREYLRHGGILPFVLRRLLAACNLYSFAIDIRASAATLPRAARDGGRAAAQGRGRKRGAERRPVLVRVPPTGVPRPRLRTDPSDLIRVMPAKGGAPAMEGTPAWGIEPVPERLRVLGLLDTGLLWGNLGVSLLVLVAGTSLVPALSLPEALLAILVGCLIGNLMLGARRRDRRRRARAGDGADARAARAARLVGPDRDQRRAVPRLDGLRAADHRHRGRRALRRAARLPRAVALDARLRRRRAALALLGPIGFVRKFVRKFAVWAVLASLLYLTWWALDGSDFGGLWDRSGEGGLSVLAGRRPRRRDHRLLGPARGRLHALRARPRERASGAPASATSSPASWLWCLGAVPLLLARPDRPRRPARRRRSGRDRRRRSRCSR